MRKEILVSTILLVVLVLFAQLGLPVVASIPIVETSVTEVAVNFEEFGTFNVTVIKTDVYKGGTHYVAFNATCKIGVYVIRLVAPPYPLLSITKLVRPAAIPSDYKYSWDGITFIKSPGPSDLWIKYDHPDVYDTYNIGVMKINHCKVKVKFTLR